MPDQQKTCVLLIDEVYVKASLTFHGGQMYGKAVNQEGKLATTVCTFMLKALFGGPEFVARALPVCGLTSVFLLEQYKPIIQQINEIPNAEVVAIITDGHRINQKFFEYLLYVRMVILTSLANHGKVRTTPFYTTIMSIL